MKANHEDAALERVVEDMRRLELRITEPEPDEWRTIALTLAGALNQVDGLCEVMVWAQLDPDKAYQSIREGIHPVDRSLASYVVRIADANEEDDTGGKPSARSPVSRSGNPLRVEGQT